MCVEKSEDLVTFNLTPLWQQSAGAELRLSGDTSLLFSHCHCPQMPGDISLKNNVFCGAHFIEEYSCLWASPMNVWSLLWGYWGEKIPLGGSPGFQLEPLSMCEWMHSEVCEGDGAGPMGRRGHQVSALPQGGLKLHNWFWVALEGGSFTYLWGPGEALRLE